MDIYTEALGLYGGLVLAAVVLVLTILGLFQPHTFSFASFKGAYGVVLYALLSGFTAFVATRVIVAYKVIDSGMRNVRSEYRTLQDLDKELIMGIDPPRLKYRAYKLSEGGSVLEVMAS